MESRKISEEYAKIGQEWIDKDPLFIDIANSQNKPEDVQLIVR